MLWLLAFRQRAFALLWTGQTISRLGDQVYAIALAWWVLQITHSATTMGLVLVAAFLPRLLFTLVGGVVADRLPRLLIMVISDGIRALLVAVIAALAWLGALPIWPVLLINFSFGVVDAFFLPAYSAVIPRLVPPAALGSANALRVLSGRVMAIVGPALGAGLVAIGGVPVAFAINSASFALSAGCLVAALPLFDERGRSGGSARGRPALRATLARFWRDLVEGLASVGALTWLWLTIAIAGVANLIAEGATSVALPFYIQQHLKTPLLYGGLTAATAAGSILGTLWFGARPARRRRGWLIYSLFLLAMIMVAVLGLAPPPGLILLAMLIYGGSATTLGLAWMTALQEYIPNERLGRVISIDELGSYLGVPLSLGLGGVLTDRFGPLPVLLWGGALAAVIVALGLFSRSVRQLE